MSINIVMKFSNNLNQYLKSNNLSLKELAKRLDVPPSTVHGWVNGIPPKNILTLKKIAEVFGCTIDDLCFGDDFKEVHLESSLVISIGKDKYKILFKKVEE